MTIAEQLQQIVAGLAAFAQENKAQVKIAHDVPHLFKILGDGPGACRVAILFAGEVCRGDGIHRDISGRVDRKFWVAFRAATRWKVIPASRWWKAWPAASRCLTSSRRAARRCA